MVTDLLQEIETLIAKTKALETGVRPQLDELADKSKKLYDAATKVSASWSGSYFGYHSELYYRNFEKPPLEERFSPEWGGINGIPPGWESRDPEEVKRQIENIAQVQFETVEAETQEITKKGQELQEELVIQLSSVRRLPDLNKEKNLLDQLEKFQWESKPADYIHANLPKQFGTRDSDAAAEGARVPADLFYKAVANECASRCTATADFLKLSQRLLRQLRSQLAQAPRGPQDSARALLDLVKLICSRLHLAGKQLSERQRGRPPFQINDEYDVQDLLHALLRLHFDDIRPEEWTPSYGGGASRMDFLLKDEKIVIEAKMARANHAAKEISDELIIDAARYKAHQDCKTLVCLVYDPNNHIKNPRGVERDLARLSGDDLEVVCIITP